jgi:hypothetical protein
MSLRILSTGWLDKLWEVVVQPKTFPVGHNYIQYPDDASNTDSVEFPTSQRPATLFGGTWEEQWNTESVFFRTGGTNSNDGRSNGLQQDQLQRWTGELYTTSTGTSVQWLVDSTVPQVTGAFPNYTRAGSALNCANGGSFSMFAGIAFDSANSSNARVSGTTSAETRVTNRRIKVWKRVA